MSTFLVLLIFALTSSLTNSFILNVDKTKPGCTADPVFGDESFSVVWNSPSETCNHRNRPIIFNGSGLIHNADGKFFGENNVIFYAIGKFPWILADGKSHNGGIPQLGDIAGNLAKVTQDITTKTPNPQFNGVAVLDWEPWRPLYDANFGSLRIYHDKSRELVKQQHPDWTVNKRIDVEASLQFETSARQFMLGTMNKVRELRPSGLFGWYGFPRCWGGKPEENYCSPLGTLTNDRMSWVFNSSNALYPRIYFDHTTDSTGHATIRKTLTGVLQETSRMQVKYTGVDAPIFPYSLSQTGAGFYTEADLDIAIRLPADMGSSGVVLWGSSGAFHLKDNCLSLNKHIHDVLGPYILKTQAFFEKCRRVNCNGNGRCVKKEFEKIRQDILPAGHHCKQDVTHLKSGQAPHNEYDAYACRCFKGKTGPNCK